VKSARPITVLIAEDRAVVRKSLRTLLGADQGFIVVGEAPNGRVAVELARIFRPDVILMDISMPVLNGLEATRQILAANASARVIILSAHTDQEYLERASELGVAGFLEKQTFAKTVARAVREVALGRAFFSSAIAKRLAPAPGSARGRRSVGSSVELTII